MASNSVTILAIDGGGIRGIIPAYILNQLESDLNHQCFQLFDIIGGTSTGAIISAGLSTPNPANTNNYPYTANQMLQLYLTEGDQIFQSQGDGILEASYYADNNGAGVEPFLQQKFGPTTLLTDAQSIVSGLPNSRIKQMFTTGCIVNSSGAVIPNPVMSMDEGPYLFNWNDAVNNSADNDYYVWEAARSSSAAPTYFPVAQVGGGSNGRSNTPVKWVVDGGVMSNNPAMWALVQAFNLGLAKSFSDITIISLGTGFYPGGGGVGISNNASMITPADGNWGSEPWLLSDMYDLQGNEARGTMVNIILDAVQSVSAMQLNMLVNSGLTYYRLEPVIPFSLSAMDNISQPNITALVNATKAYLSGPGQALFTAVKGALS